MDALQIISKVRKNGPKNFRGSEKSAEKLPRFGKISQKISEVRKNALLQKTLFPTIRVNSRKFAVPARYSSGFTLVELMAVIAIIGVLAALILGISGYAGGKSARSKAVADMEKIKLALDQYRITYGAYPVHTAAGSTGWMNDLWVKPQNDGYKPFLVVSGVTTNPVQAPSFLDPWGNDYHYYHAGSSPYATHNNSRMGYDLWSDGPDKLDAADDIDNWSAQ